MHIKISAFCGTCGSSPHDSDTTMYHPERTISLCLSGELGCMIFYSLSAYLLPSYAFTPGIYFNTQQAIYGCHVDIAMCLLTYTTYKCPHSDLILSRFCRGYAVTQRKSQCQDIRTRQAFRYYTQRTHRASGLTSGAGGIFRNHAVRHRYVLLLVSLSIATQFARS